jgi:hypothetical protein
MKMASNKKVQENRPRLKYEKLWKYDPSFLQTCIFASYSTHFYKDRIKDIYLLESVACANGAFIRAMKSTDSARHNRR